VFLKHQQGCIARDGIFAGIGRPGQTEGGRDEDVRSVDPRKARVAPGQEPVQALQRAQPVPGVSSLGLDP